MVNTVSISEKPWSDYTTADYSIEQWHNACLIHQHDGAPTSKAQCKLPIKTPNGTLNRNGVHAAAAALAGARGGVNASPEEKASAMRQLRSAYSKLEEKPPPSMMQIDKVEEFLAHWGIKGMRWGIRNDKVANESDASFDVEKLNNDLDQLSKKYAQTGDFSESARSSYLDAREAIIRKHVTNKVQQDRMVKQYVRHSETMNAEEFLAHWGIKGMRWGIRRSDAEIARDNGAAADAIRARTTQTAINKAGLSAVSDSDLNQLVSRINLEKRYADATANTSTVKKGASFIKKATVGTGATMNSAIAFYRSPAGQLIRKKLGR